MEGSILKRTEARSGTVLRSRWFAYLPLLALFGWQGWLTATLFGPGSPWDRLTNDQPIVSGRHALHLYHGYLGAQAFAEDGSLCAYDPAFQAGYPVSPVFDSGSRPAQLFLVLTGGSFRPAAYKIGLALGCLALPGFLFLAARGAGAGVGAATLATALGIGIAWSTPGQQRLQDGDFDLWLAGLAAILQLGLLVQFHRVPGIGVWSLISLAGILGWFGHPLLFLALLPLILIYYLSTGTKHPWPWHIALGLALVAGPVANAFWLIDWFSFGWIRASLPAAIPFVSHRTLRTLAGSSLWGNGPERWLADFVLGLGAVGCAVWNQRGQRVAARLFGLGGLGALGLAVGGLAWEPLEHLGCHRLWTLALWFAAIPAGDVVVRGAAGLLGWLGHLNWWWRTGIVTTFGLCLAAGGLRGREVMDRLPSAQEFAVLGEHCVRATPLEIGIPTRSQEFLAQLTAQTSTEARILWEDLAEGDHEPAWTPLLPILTGRMFLGGLEPRASIEHGFASLVDQKLAGRPLAEWTDEELAEFCRQYNVGWVVCRSSRAQARFQAWPAAEKASPAIEGYATLYRLPHGSFTLRGQARLLHADSRQLVLADVVPEDGKVVLSFHYQSGLRAAPNRVRLEREPDTRDPIPFLRLHLSGPATRVTIRWEPEGP